MYAFICIRFLLKCASEGVTFFLLLNVVPSTLALFLNKLLCCPAEFSRSISWFVCGCVFVNLHDNFLRLMDLNSQSMVVICLCVRKVGTCQKMLVYVILTFFAGTILVFVILESLLTEKDDK